MTTRTIRTALLTAAFLILLPMVARAQQPAAVQPGEAATEGIAVHGQWTIEVVRDGKTILLREFGNDLMPSGEGQLINLLGRADTPGFWIVLLQADGTGSLCADNTLTVGTDTDCSIDEESGELALTLNTASDREMLLEGSDTVIRDGNITSVATYQHTCASLTAPDACSTTSNSPRQFTATGVTPVPVQNGDQVNVQVQLTFN